MDNGSVGEAKTPDQKAAARIGVGRRLTDVSTSDDSEDAIITTASSSSLASSLRLIDSSSYQISGPPCSSGTEKGRQSAEVLGQSTTEVPSTATTSSDIGSAPEVTPHDITFKHPAVRYECCICARAGEDRQSFLSAKDAKTHVTTEHPGVTIYWECPTCDKRSTTTAGIQNHSRVCRHRTNALVNAQVSFSCGNCSATFPTQIGLSQHERHVHPSVRNQKRLATAAAPRKRTVGERSSRPKIWTEEEEQRLRELNEVYRGKYYINTLLMPHFPGKTSKQISDKRCLLGLTKPVDGQATSGRATAVSRSLDDLTQQLPLDLTINNVLRPQTMYARFGGKNLCQTSAKVAAIDSLAVEVCSIADALRTAEDITSASDLHKPKLDSIVDELTAILAGNKPLPSSNSRRGNIPNARRKPRGNRDRMRRQQYATVQSLWAKDPKLLATMVAEDTLADIEKRRQPKGEQVRAIEPLKPRLRVTGVNKGYTDAEFLEEVFNQNPSLRRELTEEERETIKIVGKKPCRNLRRETWILEAEPGVFKKMVKKGTIYFDLETVYIEEYLDALMCYKCYRFGHKAQRCKEQQDTCYVCGGVGHRGEECSNLLDCVNCRRMGVDEGSRRHSARDTGCPVWKKKVDQERSRRDYGG
nr:unnamed protein product [Callosobruchus analis]